MKFLICTTAIWIATLRFSYAQEEIHFLSESASLALKKEITKLNVTQNLIDELENSSEELRVLLQTMINEGMMINVDVEKYLQNPLNQLHLMRRYATEWWNLREKMNDILSQSYAVQSPNNLVDKTTKINRGIEFLQKLDDMYQLDAANFSRGAIPAVAGFRGKLTADECIKISVAAYHKKRYSQCAKWLQEAFQRVLGGETSLYSIDVVKRDFVSCKMKRDAQESKDYEHYKRLCRQEDQYYPAQMELKCFVKTDSKEPWWRFNSAKVEPVSLNPNITIYHDLLERSEIEFWKEETRKMIQTAKNRATDTLIQPLNFPKTPEIASKISTTLRKLRLIEDLQLQNADKLIITHHDRQFSTTFDPMNSPYISMPNDLNLLIFMTNVEQGGATVFQSPPLSVAPAMGAVVTWQNGVKVAECPVLYGDKWTANLQAKPAQAQKFGDHPIAGWKWLTDLDYDEF